MKIKIKMNFNFSTKKNRFMKKKETESHQSDDASVMPQSSHSMVDIVVRMKQDEMFANLKVSSFDLILSLEFLLKIAQFVTVPQDPKSASTPVPLASSAVARRKNPQTCEKN